MQVLGAVEDELVGLGGLEGLAVLLVGACQHQPHLVVVRVELGGELQKDDRLGDPPLLERLDAHLRLSVHLMTLD
ncbi:hypothetical protein D3C87_1883920 [compost metagenome]